MTDWTTEGDALRCASARGTVLHRAAPPSWDAVPVRPMTPWSLDVASDDISLRAETYDLRMTPRAKDEHGYGMTD